MATSQQTLKRHPAWSAAASASTVALAFLISRSLGRQKSGPGRPVSSAPRMQANRAVVDTRAARADGSRASGIGPTDIPARGWWDVAMRVYRGIDEDRILAVAAGVTFYVLLAIFPAIGSFVSLYGLIADPGTINDQMASLNGFLPSGALDVIGEQIKRIVAKGGGALSFAFFSGLAISLWSANAGIKAVFDALNVAYDIRERRSFIVLNLISFGFTAGAILFLMLALGAVVVLPIVLSYVGLGSIADALVRLCRWPAMLLVILLGLAVLYRFGPSRDNVRWRWVTPGSLFAGIVWIAFSSVFSWYITHFGSYNETYGSLGAAIGFMTWIWLSSTIILIGAEVNAEAENKAAAANRSS